MLFYISQSKVPHIFLMNTGVKMAMHMLCSVSACMVFARFI